MELLTVFGVSAQASALSNLYSPQAWIHQPLKILRVNLFLRNDWTSPSCSQTASCHPFLVVVRCCVKTTLASQVFGLPSIYLEFKFGLGSPDPAYFLVCYFWKRYLEWRRRGDDLSFHVRRRFWAQGVHAP